MVSVLYVDDERDLLELAKLFLEQSPEFQVATLTSASEALLDPRLGSYDAIISDYLMPEMDGIRFLKIVREQFGDIPFILFTGRGREDVVIDAINNGADFYLQKGGDVQAQFAELIHKVRQAVARRQAEQALRESEKRLTDIINFLPDATFATDRNGTIIAWNRAIEEMTGCPAPAMLGKGNYAYALPFYGERRPILIDLIFESDEVIAKRYAHIVREKDVLVADTNLPRLGGKAVTLLGKASPLYDSRGEVVGAIEAIRDITRPREAENELRAAYEQIAASEEELREQLEALARNEQQARESEENYRTILESIQDVYYRSDPDGNIIMASPSIIPLLGYGSIGEILGRNLAQDFWMYPEQRQLLLDEIKKQGSVSNYEVVLKRKDGFPAIVATSSHFYYGRDGSFGGVEGIFRDITAIRKADEQIRLLAELIGITPVSIIVHEREGRIIYANAWTAALHGYSLAEFMTMNLAVLVAPASSPLIPERMEQIRTCGEISFDVEHVRKDGSRLPLHVTAKQIRWDNRDVVISVAMDLTERMDAERTLFESEEQLQLALAGADLGTWNWDIGTGEVLFNDRSAEMLGYRSGEIEPDIGGWERLVHPDDLPRMQETIRAHLAGKTDSYESEHRLRHRNGSWIWVLDRGRVIQWDEKGNPLFAAGTHLDITQRKLAQDALLESEERFHRIAENAQDMIYRMSLPDGKYDYVSPAVTAMTGYTPEAFYSDPGILPRMIHPDWQQYFRDQWAGLMRGEVPPTYEYQIIDRSGTMHWLNQRNVLVKDDAGTPVALEGIVTDVTDRKATEKALHAINALYRSIVENSHDIIYTIRPDGTMTFISPSWTARLGHEPEEIVGKSFYTFVLPEDIPRCEDFLHQTVMAGTAQPPIEFRVYHKNGQVHWYRTTLKPVFDEEGSISSLVGNAMDFTDYRKAEEALRESERRYRSVIENIQDGFIRSNRDGRIIMASPSAARMLGFRHADDLLGRPISMFYKDPDVRTSLTERVAKEGKLVDQLIELKRRDGTFFWGSVNVQRVYDEKGMPAGIEGSIHDVTGFRTMERAILEANRKLSLLNSVTRHDVANQLTAMQGYIQIASLIKTDPVVRDYLSKIGSVADTITRQIEFTRTYQELAAKEPSWFRIETIVGTAQTGVPVRFSGTCRSVEILADPMLEKVFFNLFDNAVRHGRNITEITVRCEREPDGLIVIIEDDGIGVPLPEKEKIFERGYGRHTGLGLFLAREILSTTGITIRETGIPGSGARFEILVPRESVRFES